MIFRTLLLAATPLVVAFAAGCGRTEMDTLARVSASGAAGDDGPGGADAVASGPCAEAACLTSLFATCVPEGSCVIEGGGSPSASYNTSCYANGVSVSSVGSYDGSSVTKTTTVRRNGVVCYTIQSSQPQNSSGMTYVVRGSRGEAVASATIVDKSGNVTVTCDGGQPTVVSGECMRPVGDNSDCTSGTCS